MTFFFDAKEGDLLMAKINLRDISSRAKQWDHPVKGLFKYAEAMKINGGDIFKVSKGVRERYCVSIVGLALKNDSKLDWWTHIPSTDPPDGLVMTLKQEGGGAYMGYMREVEVVEHRGESNGIFDVIRTKMIGNLYVPDTILVCLVLTPGIYDLKLLATRLATVRSTIKHVFVVFSGIAIAENLPRVEQLRTTYSMVQLLPVFQQTTLDFRPHLEDFKNRYEKGNESRIIEGGAIYFGTTNPKHHGQSSEN